VEYCCEANGAGWSWHDPIVDGYFWWHRTIRLWTVVKPFRSLCMWDEALARRLFHPRRHIKLSKPSRSPSSQFISLFFKTARWIFAIRRFSLGPFHIIFWRFQIIKIHFTRSLTFSMTSYVFHPKSSPRSLLAEQRDWWSSSVSFLSLSTFTFFSLFRSDGSSCPPKTNPSVRFVSSFLELHGRMKRFWVRSRVPRHGEGLARKELARSDCGRSVSGSLARSVRTVKTLDWSCAW